ncbi:hypothetical protein Psal182_03566 (plasmid) [Piscirickettsia salmonis]|nr:hypothetical protein Psal182_03566 [Piscirickettsia salmonis]
MLWQIYDPTNNGMPRKGELVWVKLIDGTEFQAHFHCHQNRVFDPVLNAHLKKLANTRVSRWSRDTC